MRGKAKRPKTRLPSRGPGRGGLARGYKWPTATKDNLIGLKHGARSDRLVESRASELAPDVLNANPHLDPTRDGPAIFRYAVALARCERVYRWLAEQDDEVFADRESGEVHGVYERLERWERQASAAEDQLAIAPLTRARLGLDLQRAAVTAEEREEARKARERLDARARVIDSDAEEDG